MPNPYRVNKLVLGDPRVVAALQPWAEISQRLRRISLQTEPVQTQKAQNEVAAASTSFVLYVRL